jgi:hypothetical protein
MNTANTKTCAYLPKNSDPCQINLPLFFSGKTVQFLPLSACFPPRHGFCLQPGRIGNSPGEYSSALRTRALKTILSAGLSHTQRLENSTH